MSYRECAKKQTQCIGLKKGIRGYRECVSEAGCKKAPRKSRAKKESLTKVPKRPSKRPSKEVVKQAINESKPKTNRSLSSWQQHLKEFRIENPEIKGSSVMKIAKESYISPKKNQKK